MPAPVHPENLQRVGFLSCVPRLLRHFGVDPLEVLHEAGLNENALDNPDSAIPYQTMGRIVALAAQKTGCPHFGLEIGKHIGVAALGLIGKLMQNAPTLRSALHYFATHHHRNSHGGVVYLIDNGHEAFFGYAIYQVNMPGHSVISDGAGLAAFNIVRELTGAHCSGVLRIVLARSEPETLKPYLRAFGTRPRFDAEQTAIILPQRLLDQPLTNADPSLRKILERQILDSWHSGDLDTMTQLRRALRVGLLKGDVSAVGISMQLGIGRRTLQRRLDALGFSFQDALDEARCEFAKQLLLNTKLGIGEIGALVGYADPSVLTRGFTRWVGVTPSEWRSHCETRPSSARLQEVGACQ